MKTTILLFLCLYSAGLFAEGSLSECSFTSKSGKKLKISAKMGIENGPQFEADFKMSVDFAGKKFKTFFEDPKKFYCISSREMGFTDGIKTFNCKNQPLKGSKENLYFSSHLEIQEACVLKGKIFFGYDECTDQSNELGVDIAWMYNGNVYLKDSTGKILETFKAISCLTSAD